MVDVVAVATSDRLALLRLTRPWFWPLGWGGAYLGSVLATRTWEPPAAHASFAALAVLGPLVWGAVLAVNDRYDLPSDRLNPRKATAPLVTGALTETDLVRWGRLFAVLAMVVALAVGPVFAAGTGVVLLLGWLYSVPPVRLKARPGADVAVNALVVGVLAPLAGWCLYPAGRRLPARHGGAGPAAGRRPVRPHDRDGPGRRPGRRGRDRGGALAAAAVLPPRGGAVPRPSRCGWPAATWSSSWRASRRRSRI